MSQEEIDKLQERLKTERSYLIPPLRRLNRVSKEDRHETESHIASIRNLFELSKKNYGGME
jgi:hypothetical protein